MGRKFLVGKKESGKMRRKAEQNEKNKKEKKKKRKKEPYCQIYCKFAKPQMNSLPLSNPLFLSGDIFSSPFQVQSQRAPISQNRRGAPPLFPCHYLVQSFNPNDTMSPYFHRHPSFSTLYPHIFKIFSLIL
jgi:hypothetical protein